jgi:hypothetical protein
MLPVFLPSSGQLWGLPLLGLFPRLFQMYQKSGDVCILESQEGSCSLSLTHSLRAFKDLVSSPATFDPCDTGRSSVSLRMTDHVGMHPVALGPGAQKALGLVWTPLRGRGRGGAEPGAGPAAAGGGATSFPLQPGRRGRRSCGTRVVPT